RPGRDAPPDHRRRGDRAAPPRHGDAGPPAPHGPRRLHLAPAHTGRRPSGRPASPSCRHPLDGVRAVSLLNEKWPAGSDLDLSVAVTRADEAPTKAAIQKMTDAVLAIPGLSGAPQT